MKIALPKNVKTVIECLEKNNFEAYIVGGCVRDSILGLTPHDWDICTNAKPQQMKQCFEKFNTFDSGIKHGTISVVIDKQVYEVTTYRIDGEYTDNRHPESVTFTNDITKDLARRDFTVNAMAYSELNGVVDPFCGKEDLSNGIIRCVGNPDERFNEDALRIIRALRFASVYDLKIEKNTSDSIFKNAHFLSNIAVERIATEFNKLLCGEGAENILNAYRDVISVFMPEIKPTFDFEQYSKHHDKDVWRHTTRTVSSIEKNPILRMTMLLHDIGKPEACEMGENGYCHFIGHPKISEEKADAILHRLKYSTDFIETCLLLIKYHDVRYNGTKKQMKHIMSAIGEKNAEYLIKVQRADILGQSEYMREEKLSKLDKAGKVYQEVLADKECFTLKQLAVNGNDLIKAGITDGKTIGRILSLLLDLVIEEKIINEKSQLLQKAVEIKEED